MTILRSFPVQLGDNLENNNLENVYPLVICPGCDPRQDRVYYYNLNSSDYAYFQDTSFTKVPWPPNTMVAEPYPTETVITYYNQTPLFLDPQCTVPVGSASQISWMWTEHTINGVIQPFVDTMGVFLLGDGALEASTVTNVNVFEKNQIYIYRVFESQENLRFAKEVRILRSDTDIVKVVITGCDTF
jgi:hypothetical protein